MKKVMVIYHSQEHGNTAVAAKLVVQGLEEPGGIEISAVNTNEAQRIDTVSYTHLTLPTN